MIWEPDTCNCRIEYNGTNSTENVMEVLRVCPKHMGLSHKEVAEIVLKENCEANQARLENNT